jgi:hypothetical protein
MSPLAFRLLLLYAQSMSSRYMVGVVFHMRIVPAFGVVGVRV